MSLDIAHGELMSKLDELNETIKKSIKSQDNLAETQNKLARYALYFAAVQVVVALINLVIFFV